MNDQEIMRAAIKGAWPKEAVPQHVYFKTHEWVDDGGFRGGDDRPMRDGNAAALFRDSGLRWIMAHGNTECLSIIDYEKPPNPFVIELDEFQDRTMRNRQQMGFLRAEGPTLLAAIDAAIRSIHQPQSKGDRA